MFEDIKEAVESCNSNYHRQYTGKRKKTIRCNYFSLHNLMLSINYCNRRPRQWKIYIQYTNKSNKSQHTLFPTVVNRTNVPSTTRCLGIVRTLILGEYSWYGLNLFSSNEIKLHELKIFGYFTSIAINI